MRYYYIIEDISNRYVIEVLKIFNRYYNIINNISNRYHLLDIF